MEAWESLHYCRFDGYSPAYDEWVGPSRMRRVGPSNLSGNWTGYWQNSLNEKGKDSLVLNEDAEGNIKGVWSGEVNVAGKRVDASTAYLWAQTPGRSYRFTATVGQGALTLSYVAKRLDVGGSYEGKSTLTPAK